MDKYLNLLYEIENRYANILHLTGNENIMSGLAQRFYSSPLSCRYNMGPGENGVVKHGNFAAKGMPEVNDLLNDALEKANKMLKAELTVLNCLSCVHAMISTILCMTQPGDVVMTVPSTQGGHFCTKGILELTGRGHIFTEYDFDNFTFDVDKTTAAFKHAGARAIYLDTSVYLKPHPIQSLRKALGPDAIIIYDASHTMGLIMGKRFQSPLLEGADIICANTHKTLPGPHRGMIAFKDREVGLKAEATIQGSLYSTVHTNSLLALAITILEMFEYGEAYADQVINNANVLALQLSQKGLPVRQIADEIFTNNHQVHLFSNRENVELVSTFLKSNISINTSRALGDKLFIRLGVQEITRRGMKEDEMKTIASYIERILCGEELANEVSTFSSRFKDIHYGFKTNR